MTETEKKALTLLNEVLAEREMPLKKQLCPLTQAQDEAIRRAIETHDAFKREVSDAVERYVASGAIDPCNIISRFILPKPVDPLVEALAEMFPKSGDTEGMGQVLRAALAARGLDVRRIEGDA